MWGTKGLPTYGLGALPVVESIKTAVPLCTQLVLSLAALDLGLETWADNEQKVTLIWTKTFLRSTSLFNHKCFSNIQFRLYMQRMPHIFTEGSLHAL
jgi:hypothetical protein